MTRLSAQAPDVLTAPTDTRPVLDYRWWASNGPTAGYLMRLALDAIRRGCAGHVSVRRIDLHVLRLPAAAAFEVAVGTESGAAGVGRSTVTFGQHGRFAVASLLLATKDSMSSVGDAAPPAALPMDAYRPMATPSPTFPPVTGRFVYRPTAEPDGRGPRLGWDVVWLTPIDPDLRGRALVASVIDSWYPAHFMRFVRQHLRTGQPLDQPTPTVLAAASVSFTAPDAVYPRARHLLLANQVTAIADGHHFERSEVWSDRGDLLATAELSRSSLEHPGAARVPTGEQE
jgi:hypothetical protein